MIQRLSTIFPIETVLGAGLNSTNILGINHSHFEFAAFLTEEVAPKDGDELRQMMALPQIVERVKIILGVIFKDNKRKMNDELRRMRSPDLVFPKDIFLLHKRLGGKTHVQIDVPNSDWKQTNAMLVNHL